MNVSVRVADGNIYFKDMNQFNIECEVKSSE